MKVRQVSAHGGHTELGKEATQEEHVCCVSLCNACVLLWKGEKAKKNLYLLYWVKPNTWTLSFSTFSARALCSH